MGNTVRFGCTALVGTNKAGTLKPDANGYYDIVVGGLDVFNSVGEFYTYEGAKDLFQSSSQFMRRIKRGVLAGEMGHPVKEAGMRNEDFVARVLTIRENNVCCHHKEIYLDMDNVRDERGNKVIAIRSKLKPAGPHGEALRQSLENPDENVCFSIRALTNDTPDRLRGYTKRALKTIVTWDRVTEPGLSLAEKYKSPALESLVDEVFTRTMIQSAMDGIRSSGVAMESSGLMTGRELFTAMGWDAPEGAKPGWLSW
jgi:hypothetical protein